MRKTFCPCVIAVSAFILLSTEAFAGTLSFSWGNDQKAAPIATISKTKKNGPPVHAPAHGYRAKHKYRYFPSSSVYLDADRGLYFYLSGSSWQVAASLPHALQIQLTNSVSIEMDTDKPYIYNAQHRKQYPPGQMKKMQKDKNKKRAKK